MRIGKAFSPGHVTGLFYISDTHTNPLLRGSFGAGFSILEGVTTTVHYDKRAASSLEIFFNQNRSESAVVSEEVVNLYFEKDVEKINGLLRIYHQFDIPPGSGFGTSGAGALSLSLALNDIFERYSTIEAAQIAHHAEINCKTGLGTVIGETVGGFEIRKQPGAPGFGVIEKIPFTADLTAIFLVFGPFPTKRFLQNTKIRKKINDSGRSLLSKLECNPNIENFLKLSYDFAQSTELIPKKIKEILDKLEGQGITGSMMMFGQAVFTLVPESKINMVLSVYNNYKETGSVIVTKIDRKGGRVIDVNNDT